MCSAARLAVRNAKQKKTVPAKNSEVNFWRPRSTKPRRAGKRADANFACPEGFFCAQCVAPMWRADRFCAACRSCGGFCAWPALFIRSVLCLRGFFLLSFTFSCLTFASQKSFHLSLRPRRALSCLSPPVALFPACGSCHLLLFRGLLRPLPVCLFCVVYAGFLSLVFLPFPA